MFKKVALAFGVLVGIFLVYVSIQPSEFKVSREIVINAPAEAIFPYINHSEKADGWMPWKETDPNLKMNYSGPAEGVGSKSTWDSTGEMGTGEALIIESVPNQVVKTQLTYQKPFPMAQIAEISLGQAENGATVVRWSVSGQQNFIAKMFRVILNIEKMVGDDFSKGLNNLKKAVEPQAQAG